MGLGLSCGQRLYHYRFSLLVRRSGVSSASLQRILLRLIVLLLSVVSGIAGAALLWAVLFKLLLPRERVLASRRYRDDRRSGAGERCDSRQQRHRRDYLFADRGSPRRRGSQRRRPCRSSAEPKSLSSAMSAALRMSAAGTISTTVCHERWNCIFIWRPLLPRHSPAMHPFCGKHLTRSPVLDRTKERYVELGRHHWWSAGSRHRSRFLLCWPRCFARPALTKPSSSMVFAARASSRAAAPSSFLSSKTRVSSRSS